MKVLYVCHTSTELGGAAHSLAFMIQASKDFVYPIVLVADYGITYDYFTSRGIKCVVCNFASGVKIKNQIFRNLLLLIPLLFKRYFINRRCVNNIHRLKLNLDLVHTNSSVTSIGYFIAKREKVPHIWHIREFQDLDYGLKPFCGWEILRKRMKSSHRVIAISKAVYDHWHLDSFDNSVVLWNAVRSKNSIRKCEKKSKYFLFCAGSLCDIKGADFAVKAFALSNLSRIGYELVLIGSYSESYKSKLLEILMEYNLNEDSLKFIGFCNNVDDYMYNAAAFLMCSRYEALGRVTLEAMFNGCPVLARNTGGSVEFIQNGKNGYLFRSEIECSDLMKKVVYEDVSNIISSAHCLVLNNFSIENYRDSLYRLYLK